jgi:hypothetical protein
VLCPQKHLAKVWYLLYHKEKENRVVGLVGETRSTILRQAVAAFRVGYSQLLVGKLWVEGYSIDFVKV